MAKGWSFGALVAALKAPAFAVFGSSSNTVAEGNDPRIVGAMQKSNNGSDVPNASTFRSNIGVLAGTATVAGLLRVLTDRTDTTTGAALVAGSVQADAQNYADMKGMFGQISKVSRELVTEYTSSEAFTMSVHIDAIASQGSVFLSAVVSGVVQRGSQVANLAGQRVSINFLVPAGSSYSVSISGGTVSELNWVEYTKR